MGKTKPPYYNILTFYISLCLIDGHNKSDKQSMWVECKETNGMIRIHTFPKQMYFMFLVKATVLEMQDN